MALFDLGCPRVQICDTAITYMSHTSDPVLYVILDAIDATDVSLLTTRVTRTSLHITNSFMQIVIFLVLTINWCSLTLGA